MTKAAAQCAARPSRSYFDLHDQLAALEKAGLLLKVDIPVNKDTEIHPLMRWQFRGGLDENDRKAMLFTNVVDAKGKRYDIFVSSARWEQAGRFIRSGSDIRSIS